MDTLHAVLRSIRSEAPRRDHLSVFREFLAHLDRAGRTQPRGVKAVRGRRRKARRGKR